MRAYRSGRVGGATTQTPYSPSETVTPGTTSFVVQGVQVGDGGQFRQGHNYTINYDSTAQKDIWTSTSDVSKNLRKAVDKRTPHTGLWFLESKKYINWRDDETRVLVVHGRSGCGKTILSSTVIQDLMRIIKLQDPKVLSLAFYYFDSMEPDGRDTRDFLLTTILHLTEDLEPQQRSALREPYQLQSRQGLIDLVQKLIGMREKVYLVIDALDECRIRGGVQREILSTLRQLAQLPKLRILITTQNGTCVDALTKTLSLAPCSLYPISVDQIRSDIERFVNSKVEDHDWWHVPKELVDKTRKTLLASADGMLFRLTACQFDELYTLLEDETAFVRSQLEQALENLPRDVIQYYDRILQKIRPEQRRVAVAILRWLLCAKRPLLLDELEELVQFHFSEDNEVLAIVPRSYLIKTFSSLIQITANPSPSPLVWEHEMTPSHPNYATTPRSLIRKTGGPELAGDKVVQLAHGSVREYLCGSFLKNTELVDFQLDECEAHRMVGLDCLKYLKYCALVGPHQKSGCEQCPIKKPSILEYAVNQWSYHGFMNEEACSSLTSDDPPKIMDENITYDENSFSEWADSSALLINKLTTGQFPPTCLGGQTSHKTKTTSPASTGSKVVLLAELTGYLQMIGLLLSHDAPADSSTFDGTIVTAAVEGRYSRILDRLLSKTRAKQFGHSEDDWAGLLAMEMMGSGNFYDANPLFGLQTENDNVIRQEDEIRCKFVNFLLSWDYTGSHRQRILNGTVQFGQTALHLAIRRGYRLVVAALLNGGADANQEDNLGRCPIHLARELNELEIERMLLDIGADPYPPLPRLPGTLKNYLDFEDSNANYTWRSEHF